MRTPALLIGAILIVIGGLIAAGVFRYEDTDKVMDFGKLEVEKTEEKTTPVNWGYVLLGGGALVLVAGALMRR